MSDPPIPPADPIDRVGKVRDLPADVLEQQPWLADERRAYDQIGADIKGHILNALPDDWSFEGKTVLDFGCGAGRVLRQFDHEAATAELWGSDIDRASIDWLQSALCPPSNAVANGEAPPIDLPDAKFDLIYSISVFTHLTDLWAPWLLEMRRLLKPGGLLLATVHGSAKAYSFDRVDWHEAWDEDQIGMHVTGSGTPWDDGGPSVWHSKWWLRAHWARALEIVEIFPGGNPGAHDFVLARRDDREAPSVEELERPQPGEPRELAALSYSLRQAYAEVNSLRQAYAEVTALRNHGSQADQLAAIKNSASWRLTAPLRRAKGLFRRGRPPAA
ncbi:MAG: methyltransferase domain-containing protein [Solirubrobacterales bacterium]|nr:methyltransferase domain-containing protein [Solirubrobacterales bacterium]